MASLLFRAQEHVEPGPDPTSFLHENDSATRGPFNMYHYGSEITAV
jgi:hypothetical protein